MRLVDVNVLVYAHRKDSERHQQALRLVEAMVQSDSAYAVSELVLSGFLRVVTHPGIFKSPSASSRALDFVHELLDQPNAVRVSPGPRHFAIFERLIREAGAKGNLVPDAYFAALAIESGCEWISFDRDFSRFRDLSYRHPKEL